MPDELVDATSLIGSADHVAERLRAYARAGVTTLIAQVLDDSRDGRLAALETLRALDPVSA